MTFVFALLGLSLLLFGAQFLVDSSIVIARKFGISELLIGLTLVTMGTNVPEVVVSITGGIYRLQGIGVSDLVVGEILGSNIGQIGLILALIGLFGVIEMQKKALVYQSFFMIGSVVLLYIFAQDGFLSRLEGMSLVALYFVYIFPIRKMGEKQKIDPKAKKKNLTIALSKLLIGLIGIVFGAKMAIDNSVLLADQYHISKAVVGIFLLGLGTSLPELVVAMTAAAKKANGISIGNIIGSNILDGLLALGAGASIAGFNVDRSLINFDIPFLLFLSIIVLVFFYTRDRFERKESILTLMLYFGYVILKLITEI